MLLLDGLDLVVIGGRGGGQPLSAGIVSLAVALWFLVSLHRTPLRRAAAAEA